MCGGDAWPYLATDGRAPASRCLSGESHFWVTRQSRCDTFLRGKIRRGNCNSRQTIKGYCLRGPPVGNLTNHPVNSLQHLTFIRTFPHQLTWTQTSIRPRNAMKCLQWYFKSTLCSWLTHEAVSTWKDSRGQVLTTDWGSRNNRDHLRDRAKRRIQDALTWTHMRAR